MTSGGAPEIRHSHVHVHWIIKFLREERVRQRLTQEKLAFELSISKASLSQYEAGLYKSSSLRRLEQWLAYLGYKLIIEKKE